MSTRTPKSNPTRSAASSPLRRLIEKNEPPSAINVDVKVSFEGTPYITRDTAALSPREFRKLAQRVLTEHRAKRPG